MHVSQVFSQAFKTSRPAGGVAKRCCPSEAEPNVHAGPSEAEPR
jgi:hypothetical protein